MTAAVMTQTRVQSSPSTADSVATDRLRRLLQAEIDFIGNPSFHDKDAEAEILTDEGELETKGGKTSDVPRDLPAHLARLCETKLLTAADEAKLFRLMNFHKYRAHTIRESLDKNSPDLKALSAAERHIEQAMMVRDHIVKANFRLVMSVVKKFVTPQHSFDDLLSDGIDSLMHAVDKFDYDRGFRFSTYAYRAISRNAYRKIADRQKENARFASNSEEIAFDAVDDRDASLLNEHAWENLRAHLTEMMDRLDRRERFIIRSRYALGSHRRVRTFQYLADKLGVSKERVRQLEQRAVAKLQSFAAEAQVDETIGTAF